MSESFKPIKWGIVPEMIGTKGFTAAELEGAGWQLLSKEEAEKAYVWLWLSADSKKWFVALRTGGAGRGRGKVVMTAIVYSQEFLLDVVEKFQKMTLVVV